MAWITVCSVCSRLLPRSPKTTPSADNPTHFTGCPAVAAAGIELLVVMDSYGHRYDEESGGADVAGVETQK
jgi:hypothetical protein